MRLGYHWLDVFTERPLGGNPLAVFPDAAGLDAATMQAVAAEIGLSESVFLQPPVDGGTRRARIFTPKVELPFAGHPTVAAAILLASLDPDLADGGGIVLEEGVGPVAVRLVGDGEAGPALAEIEVPRPPEVGPLAPGPAELAGLLGLEPDAIVAGGRGPIAASCGVPFVLVPLRDVAALARARLDPAGWRDRLAAAWAPHLYLYAPTDQPGIDLRTRMFGPGMGIDEDPATGAAAAALAAALAPRGRDRTHRWSLTQGVEMGRPSRIELAAVVEAGRIRGVRVGGAAVRIGEGWLDVPTHG